MWYPPPKSPPHRDIPEHVTDTVQTARALEADGRAKLDQAAEIMRDIAKELTYEGWTQVDIGAALGVSKQRVSQLVNPPKRFTVK